MICVVYRGFEQATVLVLRDKRDRSDSQWLLRYRKVEGSVIRYVIGCLGFSGLKKLTLALRSALHLHHHARRLIAATQQNASQIKANWCHHGSEFLKTEPRPQLPAPGGPRTSRTDLKVHTASGLSQTGISRI